MHIKKSDFSKCMQFIFSYCVDILVSLVFFCFVFADFQINLPKYILCSRKSVFCLKNQQNTTQNYNYLHNVHNSPPHRIQTLYIISKL